MQRHHSWTAHALRFTGLPADLPAKVLLGLGPDLMALMAAIAKQGRRIVSSSSRLKRSCCVSAEKSTDEAKSDAKDEETGWIEVYPSKSAPVATLKDIANKDNRYIPMFARLVTKEEMVESSEIPKGYSLILQVRGSSSDPLAIFYASAIQVLRDRLSRRMQILVLQFARVYKLTVSEVLSNLRKNNALHMAAVTPLTEQEALDQFTYEMNAIVTETLDTKKDQQAGRLVYSLLATRNLAESNVLSTLPDLIDVHWVRQLGLYGDASVLLEDALHETDENGEIHPTLASRLSPVELRSKIRAFQRSDLHTQRVKTAHPLERLLNQSILLDLMRFWTIEPQVNIEQGRKTSGHLPSGSFIRLDPPVRGPFLDEMRRSMSVPQPFLNNPPAEVIATEVQDLVLITTNFIDRIVSRFRKEIDRRAIRNKKKASRSRAVWYTAQSDGGARGTRFRKFNPWPNRNWSTSTRMCSVASYCSSANSKRPELVLEQIGCPELTLAKAQIFPLQITIKAMATSFLACGFSTGLSSFLAENDHSVRRSNAGLTMILICSQVKLVVIDSVTFHFRQDFQDLALRTRLLNSMAQKLSHQYDLAVWSCFDSNGDEEIHENIEDDQIVFPGEAMFEKVQQANGRVFILKFLIDDRKFFWIQEPNPASDPVFVRVVNAHINGEPVDPKAILADVERSKQSSTSFSANDATPIRGEAGGSGGGGGGPGGAAVENPRNPPPVQLAELQQILANLGQTLGGSSQAFRDPGPSLVEVLKPENVIPLLENSSHWQERLAPYLPEGKCTPETISELLLSAQFRQQLEMLTHALRSGQMDLQQFGIDPTQCDFTVVSFLEAIQTQAMESVLTALRSGQMDLQQFGIDPTQCDFTVVSFLEAIQKQGMESVSSNLPDVPDIDDVNMDK